MTETFYRRANVSRQDALAGLLSRFPEADLLSFEKIEKDGHNVYAAELRLAEFPPKKDEGGSEEPKDEAPAPADDEGGDPTGDDAPPAADDGGSDDGGDAEGGAAPDFGGGDDGAPGEGEHHKQKASLEEVVNLLHQVLHAIAPGPDVAPGGPGAAPGALGPESLMDVGAPAQGDMVPPPPTPAAGGAPLPPPVKHPRDQVGSPAFAATTPEWARRRSFDTIRDDAHELTNKNLMAEAHEVFPGYRVAKIDRRQFAEENRVVVAMIRASA